jgi:hypothetical protein
VRFSHTRETSAKSDAVWNLWTELSRWPEWDEVKAATLTGDFRDGAEGMLTPN